MALVCVRDYEEKALSLLDKNARDYYQSGANDEQTLHDNISDFKRFRFRPTMLVDVSKIHLRTTILGQPISFPVCIAPTASQRMAHPLGEIANAKAAKAMNTCFVLSTIATTSAQEVAEQVPDSLKWYQLYITKNRSITREMVRRAEHYGYKALALTVDTPTFGTRLADTRNKFKVPPHLRMANFDGIPTMEKGMSSNSGSGLNFFSDSFFDPTVTWKDVVWLKSITCLPIIAKGILTGDDAERAINAGVNGIIVSNHGARQLDGVSSTIMALPEVVDRVKGRVEVYLDGGVRTGTDVLKALALGAKAVFIGRPALYGLAVNGEEGVTHILQMLKNELELAMKLSGQTNVAEISPDLVVHESRFSKL